MPVDSQVELIRALGDSNHEAIEGTAESDWLDFKNQPYRLDEPGQKWELAKDTAALANVIGGLLVVGVSTTRSETQLVEVAASVRVVPKRLIDGDRYLDVIHSWIYPRPTGIRFHWFPDDPAEEQGVIVIEIPPQHESDKYFLVRRMFDPDDGETGALGIPIREGARVVWMSAADVHSRILAVGRTLDVEVELDEADPVAVEANAAHVADWVAAETSRFEVSPTTHTAVQMLGGLMGEHRSFNVYREQVAAYIADTERVVVDRAFISVLEAERGRVRLLIVNRSEHNFEAAELTLEIQGAIPLVSKFDVLENPFTIPKPPRGWGVPTRPFFEGGDPIIFAPAPSSPPPAVWIENRDAQRVWFEPVDLRPHDRVLVAPFCLIGDGTIDAIEIHWAITSKSVSGIAEGQLSVSIQSVMSLDEALGLGDDG